ncbi:comF family protein [Lachnospiraceae bacterium 3-1]|nr:comF family protein [Lachnospiraceae bacterium 3-1]
MIKLKIEKEDFLHLLFPPRCPFCDEVLFHSLFAKGELICGECKHKLEYVREPACSRCGKPLEDERQEYCYDCGRKTFEYTQGKALWVYKGIVRDSLYRFKYHNRQEYAEYYSSELIREYGEWINKCNIQAVVPIPLSKKRLRQRGFNQAALVARKIGKKMNLPVFCDVLLRIKDTKAQKELNDEERKNNLKRAFKTRTNKVQLDHILLIDDIYTTGSTMNEAAKELKRAGVEKIYCLSVSIGRGY